MTLYNNADKNKRKSFFLILVFLILVIGLGYLFSIVLDSLAILIIATFLAVTMSFTSYWYSDKIILKMSNAKKIEKKDNPELYRIVENLCITAGLPLPDIYIIDSDQSNAFATGRNEEHAVVAVTKGLLDRLERVELEGVIAHELSHIGNRDILIDSMIVVLVGIVAILSRIFLRVSFFGRGDNKKGGAILLILGVVAAILAPIAAKAIKMAISRKREYLADASGALLTRYPEGLARALEKISKDEHKLEAANYSTAHLYISSPFKGKETKSWFTKLFMSHPPVEERIKALKGMEVD